MDFLLLSKPHMDTEKERNLWLKELKLEIWRSSFKSWKIAATLFLLCFFCTNVFLLCFMKKMIIGENRKEKPVILLRERNNTSIVIIINKGQSNCNSNGQSNCNSFGNIFSQIVVQLNNHHLHHRSLSLSQVESTLN